MPRYGRYSDNNKRPAQTAAWNRAEALFAEKKRSESITAFFEYLRDPAADNVQCTPEGDGGSFIIPQGSVQIRGGWNAEGLHAEARLARMPQPSVPAMRRLLELNFALYYTQYALQDEELILRFATDLDTASPGKLYYALRELATKSDKLDDLLLQDFTTLLPPATIATTPLDAAATAVRLRYYRQWITEILDLVRGVDAGKYAGGIAYILLALVYRIDFLLLPEGQLLRELEKTVDIYFRKDERPLPAKIADMTAALERLLALPEDGFDQYFFHARYTFSITSPQPHRKIAEVLRNAAQTVAFYRDKNLPALALPISMYGLAHCQYSYSLPQPLSDLFLLLMKINHGDYFRALGEDVTFYRAAENGFDQEAICAGIESIVAHWRDKYPALEFRTQSLLWTDLTAFNVSFAAEVEGLKIE